MSSNDLKIQKKRTTKKLPEAKIQVDNFLKAMKESNREPEKLKVEESGVKI